MKVQNGIQTAYNAFLIHAFQVGFGCTDIFNASKEAYPGPLILCRHCLASSAQASYIKIGIAIFIRHIPN